MPTAQRIASLLPSTTEMVCLLGLRDRLVAVSHECDHPPGVRGLPVLTAPKVDPHATSAEIDHQVRALVANGLSVYRIDEDRLRALQPDLILTQDACAVCAVSLPEVEAATRKLLGQGVRVVSLSPLELGDVLGDLQRVADAAGVAGRGGEAVRALVARLDAVRARVAGRPRPRVLFLEWLDPPMPAGHWTPELVDLAGGEPVLGRRGQPTGKVAWAELAAADPEVIVAAPCGFGVAQAAREMPQLLARPELAGTRAVRDLRVFVVDGNSYFNRPGPRLVDSAELLASALHPDAAGHPSFGEEHLVRWR